MKRGRAKSVAAVGAVAVVVAATAVAAAVAAATAVVVAAVAAAAAAVAAAIAADAIVSDPPSTIPLFHAPAQWPGRFLYGEKCYTETQRHREQRREIKNNMIEFSAFISASLRLRVAFI